MVEPWGGHQRSKVKELIFTIYTFVQGCPHPVDWLNPDGEELTLHKVIHWMIRFGCDFGEPWRQNRRSILQNADAEKLACRCQVLRVI